MDLERFAIRGPFTRVHNSEEARGIAEAHLLRTAGPVTLSTFYELAPALKAGDTIRFESPDWTQTFTVGEQDT
jgi:hypothetical protein